MKRLTDIDRLVVAQGGDWGGGEKDWESEVSRCKLLYRKWGN